MSCESLFLEPGHRAPRTGRLKFPYDNPIVELWMSVRRRGSMALLQLALVARGKTVGIPLGMEGNALCPR